MDEWDHIIVVFLHLIEILMKLLNSVGSENLIYLQIQLPFLKTIYAKKNPRLVCNE